MVGRPDPIATDAHIAREARDPSPAVREAQCALERFAFAGDTFPRLVAAASILADPARRRALGVDPEEVVAQETAEELLGLLGAIARSRFVADPIESSMGFNALGRFLDLVLQLRTALVEGSPHA